MAEPLSSVGSAGRQDGRRTTAAAENNNKRVIKSVAIFLRLCCFAFSVLLCSVAATGGKQSSLSSGAKMSLKAVKVW